MVWLSVVVCMLLQPMYVRSLCFAMFSHCWKVHCAHCCYSATDIDGLLCAHIALLTLINVIVHLFHSLPKYKYLSVSSHQCRAWLGPLHKCRKRRKKNAFCIHRPLHRTSSWDPSFSIGTCYSIGRNGFHWLVHWQIHKNVVLLHHPCPHLCLICHEAGNNALPPPHHGSSSLTEIFWMGQGMAISICTTPPINIRIIFSWEGNEKASTLIKRPKLQLHTMRYCICWLRLVMTIDCSALYLGRTCCRCLVHRWSNVIVQGNMRTSWTCPWLCEAIFLLLNFLCHDSIVRLLYCQRMTIPPSVSKSIWLELMFLWVAVLLKNWVHIIYWSVYQFSMICLVYGEENVTSGASLDIKNMTQTAWSMVKVKKPKAFSLIFAQ